MLIKGLEQLLGPLIIVVIEFRGKARLLTRVTLGTWFNAPSIQKTQKIKMENRRTKPARKRKREK